MSKSRCSTAPGRPSERANTSRPARVGLPLLTAVVFLVGLLSGQLIGDGPKYSNASSSLTEQPGFAPFQEAWDLVHDNYVLPEELDDTELLYGAARGMLEAVGDSGHSAFLDPTDAVAFKASLNGELIGIGVYLEFEGEYPSVTSPISGSPADEAGIATGDLIMAIDGKATNRMASSEVSAALRGAEGDGVTLEIGRPDDGSVFSVTVVRERISIDPVEWGLLPDDLFLLRLNEFSKGAGDQVREALQAARDADVSGIVLDLRGNPGGLVSEAITVGGEFLPRGSVLYLGQNRGEEPHPVHTRSEEGLGQDIPMVVLIDRGSASAAEIVAASLRDNDRAILIGVATFGTGTVVSSYDLSDGSLAAIGTALWKTPEGEFVRGIGVAPAIEVDLPPGSEPIRFEQGSQLSRDAIVAEGDDQLRAAIDELLTQLPEAAAIIS